MHTRSTLHTSLQHYTNTAPNPASTHSNMGPLAGARICTGSGHKQSHRRSLQPLEQGLMTALPNNGASSQPVCIFSPRSCKQALAEHAQARRELRADMEEDCKDAAMPTNNGVGACLGRDPATQLDRNPPQHTNQTDCTIPALQQPAGWQHPLCWARDHTLLTRPQNRHNIKTCNNCKTRRGLHHS